MIEHTNLGVYFGALAVIILFYFEDIAGEEWDSKYNASYYNLIPIPNSILVDETLTSVEVESLSVTSCSRFCWTSSSVSLYYNYSENKCYCNSDIDSRLTSENQTDDVSNELVYGHLVSTVSVSTNISTLKYDIQPYKEDCFTLYHHGYKINAVYTVKPNDETVQHIYCDVDSFLDVGADDCMHWLQLGYKDDGVYNIRLSNGTTVSAWCDQTGGGWTVFQRRQDGSVDFYRQWTDYVNGFGNAEGEYWLGLEAIYLLAQTPSSLRIDMETFGDVTPVTAYALYNTFSLTSATDKYRLSIDTYTGDCADSLQYHNEQQFSTSDSDNDSNPNANCAKNSEAGWWYKSCHVCHLNGIYYNGFYENNIHNGISWYWCWTYTRYSLKTTTMGIKRN